MLTEDGQMLWLVKKWVKYVFTADMELKFPFKDLLNKNVMKRKIISEVFVIFQL